MKTILFLCTGNYYRSRFAEILFNDIAQQSSLRWRAVSRGLNLTITNRGPISEWTLSRLAELGISTSPYLRLPLQVTAEDFEQANHVVAVKASEHRRLIEQRFPTRLNLVEFWDVHDLDCAGPEVAIPHLEREVSALISRLRSGSQP